jgi:hypothetical protein
LVYPAIADRQAYLYHEIGDNCAVERDVTGAVVGVPKPSMTQFEPLPFSSHTALYIESKKIKSFAVLLGSGIHPKKTWNFEGDAARSIAPTIRLFTSVPIPDFFSFLLPLTPSNFAAHTPTIPHSNQLFLVAL